MYASIRKSNVFSINHCALVGFKSLAILNECVHSWVNYVITKQYSSTLVSIGMESTLRQHI